MVFRTREQGKCQLCQFGCAARCLTDFGVFVDGDAEPVELDLVERPLGISVQDRTSEPMGKVVRQIRC